MHNIGIAEPALLVRKQGGILIGALVVSWFFTGAGVLPTKGERGKIKVTAVAEPEVETSVLGTAHLPSGVVRDTPVDVQWGVRCTEDCPKERKWALLRQYSNSRSCFTQTAVRVNEQGYPTAVATLQSSGDPGCDRAQEAWMAEARWEARGEPYWLAYDTVITL